jgi:hypothetical protein
VGGEARGQRGTSVLLRDTVYQAIRRAILTSEFQPGQELREQSLAERYRVSRSPVRDSLLRLEQENLVIVLPRQGYIVKPISLAEAEDIFALHLVIEHGCVAAAISRPDQSALVSRISEGRYVAQCLKYPIHAANRGRGATHASLRSDTRRAGWLSGFRVSERNGRRIC